MLDHCLIVYLLPVVKLPVRQLRISLAGGPSLVPEVHLGVVCTVEVELAGAAPFVRRGGQRVRRF